MATKPELEASLKASQESWLADQEMIRNQASMLDVLEAEVKRCSDENDRLKQQLVENNPWPHREGQWRANPSDLELVRLCRERFAPEQIGYKPQIVCTPCAQSPNKVCGDHYKLTCPVCKAWITNGHKDLDYVGHAVMTDRLLTLDPAWHWEPMAYDEKGNPAVITGEKSAAMWIRLTIRGITRPGVGTAPKGQADTLKELIGDALRNAARMFGIALDLWTKHEELARVDLEALQTPVQAPSAPSETFRAPESPTTPKEPVQASPDSGEASAEELAQTLREYVSKLTGPNAKAARDRLSKAELWPIGGIAQEAPELARALAIVGEIKQK